MKNGLLLVLGIAAGVSSASAQEQGVTVGAFTQSLIEAFGPDALIKFGEGLVLKGEDKVYFLTGVSGALFMIGPIVETPCGGRDFIESARVDDFKHVWCYSHRGNNEARRDLYVSYNGDPFEYEYSFHYDCQITADRKKLPYQTKTLAC